MDKYEYNLKLEEITKLADQGYYEDAADIIDTIDWRRVRNVRTLCMISEIYEEVGRLQDSKALLLRAYRKSQAVRSILFHLTEISVKLREFDDAAEFYSEFVEAAPHDNSRYLLKYMIYRGRGAAIEDQIEILEQHVDDHEKDLINNHIERIMNSLCNPLSAVIFSDLVTDLERCSDHAINLAYALKERPSEMDAPKII